jgi:biopolymer transport protein ExbB
MTMNDTYGIAHLWAQGDWVIRGATLLLLGLSVASWAVMLGKGARLWRHARGFATLQREFWHTPGARRRAWPASAGEHPLVRVAAAALQADARYPARGPASGGALSPDEWLSRTLQAALEGEAARQHEGLPLLASVSSTAPFIGLFGTVWGIYHALLAIGASGEASLDRVAGPVGEALAMTALGLAVAIPATFGYNLLTRYGRAQLATLRQFGRDLQLWLVTGVAPVSASFEPAPGEPAIEGTAQ